MAVQALHCSSCGEPWKYIRFEKFVRIGPAWRQCRMCLAQFESEEREWLSLGWTARIGYLAQNLLRIAPLALLFGAAMLISAILGLVPGQDLIDYSLTAGLCFLGLFGSLTAWSLVQILRSVLRSLRAAAPAPASRPAANRVAANSNYISDAAWQATVPARHPVLQPEPVLTSGLESVATEPAQIRGRVADESKLASLWQDWRTYARNNKGRQSQSLIGEPSGANCAL
jgi:hypothetical protein